MSTKPGAIHYVRGVVGWALLEKPNADLVVNALDVAYEQRGKPQGLLAGYLTGQQAQRDISQYLIGPLQLDPIPSVQRWTGSGES